MSYKEILPDQCPPADAFDKRLKNVCRFLFFPIDDPKNFHSHYKLGKDTGNADECRAMSVSLFAGMAVPDILAARRTAFFKKKKICLLDIKNGRGKSKESDRGHIDLWPYSNFDESQSTVKVYDTAEELMEDIGNDL